MARKELAVISLALALATMLWSPSSAQSSGCAPPIVTISPCISYIIGNSSTPSASCCSQLTAIIKTQAPCLCAVLGSAMDQLGLIINATQLLTGLPHSCGIPSPSASQCSVSGPAQGGVSPATPSTPSTPSIIPSSPTTPLAPPPAVSVPSDNSPNTSSISSIPSIPSGSGSKTTPEMSSAKKSMQVANFLLLFLVCVSSYGSITYII